MLEVGVKAPDFELPDQNGKIHRLSDYTGKKVILYFYPKDNTAGVYGPPFITPVANAAKRNDLIAPGIICATLGLAIGNFIGIGVGQLFLLLM